VAGQIGNGPCDAEDVGMAEVDALHDVVDEAQAGIAGPSPSSTATSKTIRSATTKAINAHVVRGSDGLCMR
jgi:hypothetical protein